MADHPPPKKSLGQHFLHDKKVLSRIVKSAELSSRDIVLEIGAGRGHLTRAMAGTGAQIIAVEIDDALVQGPLAELANMPNVDILPADALEVDPQDLFQQSGQYKFVANLPYHIGSKILRNFICGSRPPVESIVMLQREVAQNLAPKNGKLGISGAVLGAFADCEYLFSVKPSSFRPVPKVMSGVVKLKALNCPKIQRVESKTFFNFIVGGFAAPRKQIHNSLANGFGLSGQEAREILLSCGIDPMRRPGTLQIVDWVALFYTMHGRATLSKTSVPSKCDF